MAKLLVLYSKPADPAAFDRHYFSTHVPLAKAIPGLRAYEVSSGPIPSATGGTSPHLIAALEFDSVAAIEEGLGTAQGRAAAADLANFATAGVELLMYETRSV